MTKNKKHKTTIRAIAKMEGVSFTRATLLSDTKYGKMTPDVITEFVLNREWIAGWSLYTVDRGPVKVHFDSDSPHSQIPDPETVGKNRGIPHYVISKGTQAQRFRFLNGIRQQISDNVCSENVVLRKNHVADDLSSLISLHGSRRTAMEKIGIDSFTDLRVDATKKNGTFDADTTYLYVFIYDWDELMSGASDVVKNQVDYLLEHGKKTGIHFIISVGIEDDHVKMWDERSMVRFITIRSAYSGHPESAVTRIGGLWRDVAIPSW